MDSLFAALRLADTHRDLIRNIVSLRESQDLFDDLSTDAADWKHAQITESAVKPPPFSATNPIIHRPFEEAAWYDAITWPFENWQASRYSSGKFGVWYGGDTVETTVHETIHHWVNGLLADAGFENEPVTMERKLYRVACDAALLDLRPQVDAFPALIHASDYTFTQTVGTRLHHEGHPGLVTASVRNPNGESYAIFTPNVLSNPRNHSSLTYRIRQGAVVIEKTPGTTWRKIFLGDL